MGKALLFSLLMAFMLSTAGYVGLAEAEVPSIVSLDDVNGSGSPEVSVLLVDTVYGKNYAYVVDASDGVQISSALFGDGGTIPAPVSQTVVPDFDDGSGGGPNGADEIAMLGVRPDDGSVVVLINDASTGNWIQTLGFDADFPPVAMAVVPDMNGNGISEIAVLGVRVSDGKVMVLIKDASTNGWIPSLTFDANSPPSAMEVVEYASGTVGIAVLGVNPVDGNVKVVIRDVSTRNKIGSAIYFDADYPPIEMALVPDINGNSEPEIAVLGVNSTDGQVRVLIVDASSGDRVNAVFFSGDYSPIAMAVLPDVNGSGSPEIALLGVNSTDGAARALVKAASSGDWIKTLGLVGSNYSPIGMTVVPDMNGSGSPEIAVLVVNSANGRLEVVIKDASTDALVNRFTVPPSTTTFTGVTAIAAGMGHSMALKTDGAVWAWGYNYWGQLGDGTTTDRYTPVPVCAKGETAPCSSFLTDVASIAGGYEHSMALKTDGTVWAWGYNWAGQLGIGTNVPGVSTTPVQVCAKGETAPCSSFLTGVIAIAGGHWDGMALKADGTVWAWGENWAGQLGDGTTTSTSVPVQVCAEGETAPCSAFLTGVTAIVAGPYHSMVVKTDGTVWAWGSNRYGELGDGTTETCYSNGSPYPCNTTPLQVTGLTDVTAIAAGYKYSMAVKTDGTVWAWGYNRNGGLGDGTTTISSVPVQVCAEGETAPCSSWLTDVTAIAAGRYHSIALKTDGTVWAWGSNYRGQLGDGTTTDRYTPVQVCTPGEAAPCSSFLTDVASIAGGHWHTLALKTDGSVWTWGHNGAGQLGDGTTTARSTPVQVINNTWLP